MLVIMKVPNIGRTATKDVDLNARIGNILPH